MPEETRVRLRVDNEEMIEPEQEEDVEESVEESVEEQRWFIDVDWLKSQGRQLTALASGSLCSDCRKRLTREGGSATQEDVLAAVRECCSGDPDYITGGLPIMESIFRLFLANGNEPLDLIDLGRQLSERRGIDTYRTSIEILSRLLEHDDYYGLRPFQG